ncbi:hypothetical protein ACVWWD_004754 [Mesorhizobium sp. URHB0026]
MTRLTTSLRPLTSTLAMSLTTVPWLSSPRRS